MPTSRLLRLSLILMPLTSGLQAADDPQPAPQTLTAQDDLKRMMDLLQIDSLRQGADGHNPRASNAANYDEAKANPYPKLPDPLLMKNGKRVTTAKQWWEQRRPEIVEDFDREIYGRMPPNTPKLKWEVVKTPAAPKAMYRWSRNSSSGTWTIRLIQKSQSTFSCC